MKNLFFLYLLSSGFLSYSQDQPLSKPGRVIFYNLENLFDTINDPETKDDEFLPSGKNQWNTEKYQEKLTHISVTIRAMLDTIQPFIVGLCEVENKKVLEDLVAQPALRSLNLWIIHHDSPDERGIDVAFLYKPQAMKIAFDSFLSIQFPFDSTDNTRNIHYMKVYLNEGEPVWLFVNHWPSRSGGVEQTNAKRMYAARVLKDKIDNVLLGEPFAYIVVMGDLNDNPSDSSVCVLTNDTNSKRTYMVNLMKPLEEENAFTLKHRNQNCVFDQFIVSENLLKNDRALYIRNSSAHIFSPSFLLYEHEKYGAIPNRGYVNGNWVGGYSDHLPVYFDIMFR